MAMNIEQARLNMVENQVRPWEVLDGRVLDVISRVRREDFVTLEHRQLAFADLCLRWGCSRPIACWKSALARAFSPPVWPPCRHR
jgi:protein-L-isoaspartate O-methyltransferase